MKMLAPIAQEKMIVDDIEGIDKSVAWTEVVWLLSFFPLCFTKEESLSAVLAPWDCAGRQSPTERFLVWRNCRAVMNK